MRTSRLLLIGAWILFIASMPTPAVENSIAFLMFLRILDYTPTALLLAAGLVAFARVPWSPYGWLLLTGPIAFLSSPWLARQCPPPGWLRRTAALLLLTPWAFPILVYSLTPAQRAAAACEHIYWGYYLFAAAHTLAFIAVQIAPWPRRADRRRGFEVIAGETPSPKE